ncbi:MAG: hypothetical protein K1X53_04620 [Candidatus Sumerlaeaceae bacterium]|nr:hypothetical protein [Candidatus Sumerlaeaceae bacterium]
MPLTDQELLRICDWEPYRADWPVNRNSIDDNIRARYGGLISALHDSSLLRVHQTQDGGMSNYLEFWCRPTNVPDGEAVAEILLCVCLCAPVAAYCESPQVTIPDMSGTGFLDEDSLNQTRSPSLREAEAFIRQVLVEAEVELLDKSELLKLLPAGIVLNFSLMVANPKQGLVYEGLFQFSD